MKAKCDRSVGKSGKKVISGSLASTCVLQHVRLTLHLFFKVVKALLREDGREG